MKNKVNSLVSLCIYSGPGMGPALLCGWSVTNDGVSYLGIPSCHHLANTWYCHPTLLNVGQLSWNEHFARSADSDSDSGSRSVSYDGSGKREVSSHCCAHISMVISHRWASHHDHPLQKYLTGACQYHWCVTSREMFHRRRCQTKYWAMDQKIIGRV